MNDHRATTTHPNTENAFCSRYADARIRWSECVSDFGTAAVTQSFPTSLLGPDGERLATDCLWLGAVDAPRVIVLIAGTHGIEGYAGSAIQLQILKSIQSAALSLPPDCALLCVHALTPWGMAWYRRCDEHGIDLNRNFVDFLNLPESPDYAAVQDCLRLLSIEARAAALQNLKGLLGQRRYEIAVSGGQYQDATAAFFGGRFASHGRRVIEALIDQHQLFNRTLQVLDLHTGLGARAVGELICDHLPGSPGLCAAFDCFGSQITQPSDGSSSSVPKHGLLDYAWHAGMNERSFFLTLEFGTASTQDLFDCLDLDHRFWAKHPPLDRSDPAWVEVRTAMMKHFCPDDSSWREQVLTRAEAVFQQTLLARS